MQQQRQQVVLTWKRIILLLFPLLLVQVLPVLAHRSNQGQSNMTNDEVLARMMSRMDLFDTRLNGMETMIADHFQSIEIMSGRLDSRMDTMQGQLQTILQLLQPPPPPVN
ncbi:hypothetical protein JCGZ_10972 [Jatropha curcas]|uniref:Uncharacterized protein n=1 Tax=Jatropha curcas TaxID=180498 RepID=A0A067LH40_JATCU|nr:hypothetical protein JCGZ_10972 [Jatropha curcas]